MDESLKPYQLKIAKSTALKIINIIMPYSNFQLSTDEVFNYSLSFLKRQIICRIILYRGSLRLLRLLNL